MSGINAEEYLTTDDYLMVFEEVTEEDNPFRLRFGTEITEGMENDDEEDDDTDTSQSVSTLIRGGASGGPNLRCCAPVGKNVCTPFQQRDIQLIDK
ncbi:hypothetical protein AVEN_217438-1 [Araneus ventricosus]|uniref:Uncharacterized protein n=1 Tax=Araneus ventricosus TaxID=182803 RepID=A0A4Y2T5V1_ARAVE|nr:hypothetical protein AVEN_217438-1 [Araneus ventricosus]